MSEPVTARDDVADVADAILADLEARAAAGQKIGQSELARARYAVAEAAADALLENVDAAQVFGWRPSILPHPQLKISKSAPVQRGSGRSCCSSWQGRPSST